MRAILLIKNANVIFPERGEIFCTSLAVENGRLKLLSDVKELPEAELCVDASELYASAAFLDHHTHVFAGGSLIGVNPDVYAPQTGCSALADAGSTGAANFRSFYATTVVNSKTRVFAYLNVSSIGQLSENFPENADPKVYDEAQIRDLIAAYPEVIRGLKLRFDKSCVGKLGLAALEGAKRLASDLKLPLVVHVANHPAAMGDIVSLLGKGDVVCHFYQGCCEGILDDKGNIKPQVLQARERGVLFDSADGRFNNSFAVIERALAAGFTPDIISTDMIPEYMYVPGMFSLCYDMSKYLAFGMSLTDVVKAVTCGPYDSLRLPEKGRLYDGAEADLCLFELQDKSSFIFKDFRGKQQPARNLIRPLLTVTAGSLTYADNSLLWSGRLTASWQANL